MFGADESSGSLAWSTEADSLGGAGSTVAGEGILLTQLYGGGGVVAYAHFEQPDAGVVLGDGAAPTPHTLVPGVSPLALAVDGTNVYWASVSSGARKILSCGDGTDVSWQAVDMHGGGAARRREAPELRTIVAPPAVDVSGRRQRAREGGTRGHGRGRRRQPGHRHRGGAEHSRGRAVPELTRQVITPALHRARRRHGTRERASYRHRCGAAREADDGHRGDAAGARAVAEFPPGVVAPASTISTTAAWRFTKNPCLDAGSRRRRSSLMRPTSDPVRSRASNDRSTHADEADACASPRTASRTVPGDGRGRAVSGWPETRARVALPRAVHRRSL
jgi:hypothetical protein